MTSGDARMNTNWANLMVEELVRQDVTFFCLSPGARCTPLTLAVSKCDNAVATMHYDERGAAFHALGYARATNRPAALICTSGTAVANYFPAVVEASMDNVPMILLTADRPPELHQTGANQCIDQIKIFGDYVRCFVNMPCPDERIEPQFVLTTVDQAVHRAQGYCAGPVHINCMFREPLAPKPGESLPESYLRPVEGWMQSDKPYTTYEESTRVAAPGVVERIAERLEQSGDGLIVVGQLRTERQIAAVSQLVHKAGWPLLPDILSGLRLGAGENSTVLPYYDLMLQTGWFESKQLSTVLHIGGRPTSKHLLQLLERVAPENYIHLSDHPLRIDPVHRISDRIEADIVRTCMDLAAFLPEAGLVEADRSWSDVTGTVNDVLAAELDSKSALTEPSVARLISQGIDPEACLFLANSRPIRDMDSFADSTCHRVPVACNRGASGIDGTLASAAGFARGLDRKLTVLIGDLALLHDLNSLALLKKLDRSAVIVVINNNGGGIFSFLPVHEHRDVFESYFGTPHDMRFDKAASMFGCRYVCPESKGEFVAAYRAAQDEAGPTVIEVLSDRGENLAFHGKLHDKVRAHLNKS